jgi:hypothetical protein
MERAVEESGLILGSCTLGSRGPIALAAELCPEGNRQQRHFGPSGPRKSANQRERTAAQTVAGQSDQLAALIDHALLFLWWVMGDRRRHDTLARSASGQVNAPSAVGASNSARDRPGQSAQQPDDHVVQIPESEAIPLHESEKALVALRPLEGHAVWEKLVQGVVN